MTESVTRGDKTGQETVVVHASSKADLRRFVEVPFELYARDPYWVPPLRRDELRRLSPRHNAFLDHADITRWLATSNGQVSGRIAAIDDRLHSQKHGEHVTWFGFFEARDLSAAKELLEAVEHHARDRGSRIVRGPVNPSLNESAGLLIDGFDSDPYILMPYNPPSYARFIEAAGYTKAKDLFAWDLDMSAPPPDRVQRLADRVRRRHGVEIRPLDLNAFDRDLAILHEIYRKAWHHNWGFVAPTEAEMLQLAAEFRPVLDPDIVLFAEMNGRPVACAVALPDLNQVLKRMRGRLWPFGLLHFLRRRLIVTRARLLLLGVVPEARRIGLYPLLIVEIYRRGMRRGYRRGELSWTLEDNDLVNVGIEAAGGVRYKTYRLYERTIG